MTLKSFALFATLPLAFACGTAEEAEQFEAQQDVATTAAALCTDNGAADHSAAIGSAPGSTVASTSPDANYGSATCQGRYVVEATNTSGKSLQLRAYFGDLPQSQSACASTRIRMIAYGQRLKLNPPPQRPSYVWEQIGPEKTGFGQWVSFFGGPYHCEMPVQGVGVDVGGQYLKVRVSARAELPFFDGPGIPQRVGASVSIPLPPPA